MMILLEINLFLFIICLVFRFSFVFVLIVVWSILFVEICGILYLFIKNWVCVFLFVLGVLRRIICMCVFFVYDFEIFLFLVFYIFNIIVISRRLWLILNLRLMVNICISYIVYEWVLFCYIVFYVKYKFIIFNLFN